MSIRLYTSRWANKDLAHLAVVPTGISRGVPRWRLPYRYRMLRSLAPSREIFGLAEQEFTAAYRAQLDELGVERILADLARIGGEHGGRPLVLLCWEKAPDLCHRGLLAQWLEERAGIVVPELPRNIPGTSPPGQEKLFESVD